MYKIIANHPNPREIYLKKLVDENVVNVQEGSQMEKEFDDMLQERLNDAKQIEKAKITNFLEEVWTGFRKSTPNDFINSLGMSYTFF